MFQLSVLISKHYTEVVLNLSFSRTLWESDESYGPPPQKMDIQIIVWHFSFGPGSQTPWYSFRNLKGPWTTQVKNACNRVYIFHKVQHIQRTVLLTFCFPGICLKELHDRRKFSRLTFSKHYRSLRRKVGVSWGKYRHLQEKSDNGIFVCLPKRRV